MFKLPSPDLTLCSCAICHHLGNAAFPPLAGDPAALEEVIKHLHTIIGPLILNEWGILVRAGGGTSQHEDIWRSDASSELTYVDIVVVANLHSHLGSGHRLTQANWGDIPAFTKLGLTPK